MNYFSIRNAVCLKYEWREWNEATVILLFNQPGSQNNLTAYQLGSNDEILFPSWEMLGSFVVAA